MFRVDNSNDNEVTDDELLLDDINAWDEYQHLFYPHRKRTYLRVLEKIKPVGHQNLLDVGSAAGWFMELAAARGYQTWGIEPSETIAKIGYQRTGRPIQIAKLEHAPYADHFFHVVSLFDVLEHTIDPFICLTEVRRLLVNDGIVVIRVPDMDGLLPKIAHWLLFITSYRYWKPTHLLWRYHRWGFNRRSLDSLFEKSGFDIITQYREDAQDISNIGSKHWAGNIVMVNGVKAIVYLSHLLRMQDEIVTIARVST
jgi:SAM-dependent methyltransferase